MKFEKDGCDFVFYGGIQIPKFDENSDEPNGPQASWPGFCFILNDNKILVEWKVTANGDFFRKQSVSTVRCSLFWVELFLF